MLSINSTAPKELLTFFSVHLSCESSPPVCLDECVSVKLKRENIKNRKSECLSLIRVRMVKATSGQVAVFSALKGPNSANSSLEIPEVPYGSCHKRPHLLG